MADGWDTSPMLFVPIFRHEHKKLCASIALQVHRGVVKRTPEVTGNLQASWNISVGDVDRTIVTSGSVGSPAAPAQTPASLGELPDFPVIYVSNSQPYAQLVENGGPNNEPHKMMAVTLESVKR
jgi:uncharacterized protein CbrC (UPF0167 family)